MDEINKIIMEDLNEEHAGFWQILKCFLDREAKSWSEIKNSVKLSQVTISRRLKTLQKIGVLKRKVVPAFPPKTVYELNQNNQIMYEYLKTCMKILEKSEEVGRNYIEMMLEADLIKNNRRALKGLMAKIEAFLPSLPEEERAMANIYLKNFIKKEDLSFDLNKFIEEQLTNMMSFLQLTILTNLQRRVETPFSKFKSEWVPLLTTLTTMNIMLTFWTIYEALTVSEEVRKEAIMSLKKKIEGKMTSMKKGEFEACRWVLTHLLTK
ncbi:MAG: winged helix-turn-helix transcriptional regulator [Candidatus Baldrarchaeia archaeon]